MARRKSRKEQEETLVDIVEVRDSAVGFYEQNQKWILGVGTAIVLILAGYLAYQFLYMGPRVKNAQDAMYMAEYQFSRDSFALALENPGQGYEGFLDIIYSYKGTDQANTSKYYAGVSYLNLGRFDDAIHMLKSFKAPTPMTKASKFGALGDAYSELGDLSSAESNYRKAANASDIETLAPFYLKKLAMLYQYQSKKEEASKVYQELIDKYPSSEWADEAKKFVQG